MKNYTTEELKNFMSKYESNRDINYHSENAVLLTDYFGTTEEKATAKLIFETHEKQGFLNPENASLRTELFKTIWQRIDYLFKNLE